tara:strand:+ start:420 stop:833 length:414 start_codon:yes stop_codon:yes gene_type:complete
MRDTLIGITTMVVLFGMVWLSQSRSNLAEISQNKVKKSPIEDKYGYENSMYVSQKDKGDNPCDYCNEESIISDDITFSDAFKICRVCLGDEGTFAWRGNLYSTKIKENTNNLSEHIVEESIESIPPPEDKEESVFSN